MLSTDIRYVVLSDLHLGQDRCVLTAVDENEDPDPSKTEPTLEALMNYIWELVGKNSDDAPKPTLILLGDVLGLVFTELDVAGSIFMRFVEKWRHKSGDLLFDKVPIELTTKVELEGHDHCARAKGRFVMVGQP